MRLPAAGETRRPARRISFELLPGLHQRAVALNAPCGHRRGTWRSNERRSRVGRVVQRLWRRQSSAGPARHSPPPGDHARLACHRRSRSVHVRLRRVQEFACVPAGVARSDYGTCGILSRHEASPHTLGLDLSVAWHRCGIYRSLDTREFEQQPVSRVQQLFHVAAAYVLKAAVESTGSFSFGGNLRLQQRHNADSVCFFGN